jgi:hypothetical protein
MQSWQIAVLVIVIGITLIAMAYLYLRPRAEKRQQTSAFSSWKLLMFFGFIISIVGVALFLLPESLWWG